VALSFRIVLQENSEDLHLNLMGDLDGSSACELLEVLKKKLMRFKKCSFTLTN
jgi:hypothetical protein